jgi:hypothetical protein
MRPRQICSARLQKSATVHSSCADGACKRSRRWNEAENKSSGLWRKKVCANDGDFGCIRTHAARATATHNYDARQSRQAREWDS